MQYLRFIGASFLSFFLGGGGGGAGELNSSLLLRWMFDHDCLDTCCFGCLICMCFVFLYLHLFGAIEHVSHGMAF